MKYPYLLGLAMACSWHLHAQTVSLPPAGGGDYPIASAPCVAPQQAASIQAMLEQNRRMLIAGGKLPATAGMKATALSLAWPLKQSATLNYAGVYGISNYVDHDTTYPNHVLDWNCGSRTYDLSSGYNHGGMDIFLWPFDINMMEDTLVQIVAAAPGIIIAKSDGNFDHNCAMGNSNWNAVYVQHSDNTVAWYGHMKTGSLTTKNIGAAVATGEFLGFVGSSGSSTGPHLHFELHDAAGKVMDPYFGNCSNSPTQWQIQKPYYESAINALMTHSAPPVFNTCPMRHTVNVRDTFMPGQSAVFGAYYHDQMAGQTTTYTILRPDNSVFSTWQHAMTQPWYAASWWYWTQSLPGNAPTGVWHFKAAFQSQVVQHDFVVGSTVGVPEITSSVEGIYPNPARDLVYLSTSATASTVRIYAASGQLVYDAAYRPGSGIPVAGLANGMYFLYAGFPDGQLKHSRFVVQH